MSLSGAHVFHALIINDLEMGNVELASGERCTSCSQKQVMQSLNISLKKNSVIQVV